MTAKAFREGVRMCLPYVPGYFIMGAAVGTFAAQKGLTFTEAVVMNALVCAAAAQMVALELWTSEWTWFHVLAVAGVAFMVNMRFVLSGASLRPWLAPVPAGFVYPVLGVLTDPAWAASIRYNADGGRDFGFIAGASLFLWLAWAIASMPGYFIGALIDNPRTYGLDLLIAFTFTATLDADPAAHGRLPAVRRRRGGGARGELRNSGLLVDPHRRDRGRHRGGLRRAATARHRARRNELCALNREATSPSVPWRL